MITSSNGLGVRILMAKYMSQVSVWDGLNHRGAPVPKGIYYAKIKMQNEPAQRIPLIKL